MRISDWSSDVCSSDLPDGCLLSSDADDSEDWVADGEPLLGAAVLISDEVVTTDPSPTDCVEDAFLADVQLLCQCLDQRSAERPVGKECVRPCRYTWWTYH